MNQKPDKRPSLSSVYLRLFTRVLEHSFTAWSILFVSLVLTFVAWLITDRVHAKRIQDRFAFRASRITESIEERMLEYEQVLRGGVGLYSASDEVSREEWRSYVEHCQLSKYFPGIQGMGVSIPVTAEDKSNHEASIRNEGFPDYEIRPTNKREFYTSIIFLEPFDWRNQRAFGYDMYSNPIRREAMDRAIETGEPAMSGKVTLVQETDTDIQWGWLYYLPVFKDSESEKSPNQDAPARSRGDLKGFVYAAFRANDLMEGILDEQDKEIKFEIYDSSEPAKEHLLFDSDQLCHLDDNTQTEHTSMVPISIRGRAWSLYFESRPGLIETSGSNQGLAVAVGGLAFDFLLFLVIASIGRQKRRAVEIANEMTEDVRASEDLIRKILINASEAIVTIDENGHVAVANRIARQMFGFPNDSQIKFDDYLSSQSWSYLVGKFNQTSDCRYTCTVEASRGKELETFVCRLSMGSFVVSKKQFHILVARDETARIESDRKIAQINNELVLASKTAGKVELTNGVLHNVGNIVNSINVSTNVIKKQIEKTSVANLEKVCQLVTEHETDFAGFVQNDSRGKKLPRYLQKVSEALVEENRKLEQELRDLTKNVTHITGVIKSQQSDAKSHSTLNALCPKELLDDALTANKANLANHDVEIILEVDERLAKFYSDKHKILQILVNLIKNANESVVENQTANPQIIIRANSDQCNVVFAVVDNGVGISCEKIDQIFDHGFSTKQSGHGFGLHSSIKAASDLGGELTVSSPGLGSGASFKLSIPITTQSSANELVASHHANPAF